MSSYNARMQPDNNIPDTPIREHCSAHHTQITTIGRNQGEQVRLERYARDGVTLLDFALYTVIAMHDQEPDLVFVGFRDPESTHQDLHERPGLSGSAPFTGRINSQVTDDTINEDGGFVERLIDNGHHQGLIVIAPHGGNIKRHTNEQAERVRQKLESKCISLWMCQGFKEGGGAFDSWHITSTDISEESFPKLKMVIGRGFEYAIAFHGWDEDSICIGGSAHFDLKQQIKTAIESALASSGIAVTSDGGCPPNFNGNDQRNIVNRLATKGIQIEQSLAARSDFACEIADAVAEIMSSRIQICTAPVFEASNLWTCLMNGTRDFVRVIVRDGRSFSSCEIKRLLFRIRNCRKGNSDPCIEL
jgi:phage replication-related protein YjqB (UPF0714/DUF867 family)